MCSPTESSGSADYRFTESKGCRLRFLEKQIVTDSTRWRPVVSLPTIAVIETMICQVFILPQDVIHTPLQEITCQVWIYRMLNAQRHSLMKLHILTWVALQALLRVARYTLLSTHLSTYPTPRRSRFT